MHDPLEVMRLVNTLLGVYVLIVASRCLPSWRAESGSSRLLGLALIGYTLAITIASLGRYLTASPGDVWVLVYTILLVWSAIAITRTWKDQT